MAYNEKIMKKAYQLAKSVKGLTSPNPAVGAVIVKNNQIISIGKTGKPGEAHAEIDAINKCKINMENAEMYVTLEPCCFFGRTPPCTEAIIKSGIKKVYIGTKDPNPKVNGRGIQILNNACIETEVGFLRNKLIELNEDFFKYIQIKTPFVLVKYAQTLDGKIAGNYGKTLEISSIKSLKYVHKLRSIYDGILVGAQTIINDNPFLTVRYCKGRNPKRIILDPEGLTPLNSNVLIDENETIIITDQKNDNFINKILKIKNKKVIVFNNTNNIFDLEKVLKKLGELGIISVLVEGGQKTITSFFEQKQVDKVNIFISPKFLLSGISPTSINFINKNFEMIKLKSVKQKKFLDDVLITGYLSPFYNNFINEL